MKHLYTFIGQKALPFLVFTLVSYHLYAQNQSFGAGIGINSLFSNGVNLPENPIARLPLTMNTKKSLSKPQMSLNVEYNFPNRVSNKWLGRIYNPVFSNPHLQLRGQVMFNQFRIGDKKNNSIMSLGGSVLYFPVAFEVEKKVNFFIETGYKAAWNNAALDPFHCFVLGIGTRHKMANDWLLQMNMNYTLAFTDYVDQYGLKGFTLKNSDGYALFNVSILKTFFNSSEKKALDGAKDSLGMARSFAVQANIKGQKVVEDAKMIQKHLKPLLDKVQTDKAFALKLSETALGISDKAISVRLNLKKSLDVADREIDSLKTAASTVMINRLVEYKKVNDVHFLERDIDKKIQELQRDAQETRQNLKRTFQYLPFLKQLETEVQRINVKEGGEARISLGRAEQAIAVAQKEYDAAQKSVLEITYLYEKVDKNLKNALEDIEKTEQEIKAMGKKR
jgi:hypothetical protein